ncbi:MAG TPA: hypothetical protein VFT27_08060 [Actinomycetota bacterium]|nr:hypothetical protein [Actinomycetota bacterium]
MQRILRPAVAVLMAGALGLGVGALAPVVSSGQPAANAKNAKVNRVVFHEQMLRLWENHVAWTRLFIVSFAEELPDQGPTAARLLQNQVDIGDAIKPFYGDGAGDQLTSLLQEHISIAVDVLTAAKAGDDPALEAALDAWYANGRQIADFLHAANPDHWGRRDMRSMMRMHLDLTLQEASDRLAGDYTADIADYDAVEAEIAEMSHMLARGIVLQFPQKFS